MDISASVPPALLIGYGNTSNAKMILTATAVMKIGNRLILGGFGPGADGTYWGSGTLIIDGGSLSVGTGDSIIVGASPSSTAGTMTLNSGATLQYDGPTFSVPNGGSGAKGVLTVNGEATLKATNAVLRIGNPAGNSGSVVINGGTVAFASMVIGANTYNVGSGSLFQSAGDVTVIGNVVLGPNGSSAYNGKYTLTGGTLTIAGANGLSSGATYGGGTLTISNGVLRSDKIGSGKLITRFSGGTLSANSNGGLSISTDLELPSGGAGAIFDTTVGPISVSSILSGSCGFSKTGTGTLSLSKTNACSGPISVAAGTLQINAGGRLSTCMALIVQAGATLAVASGVSTNSLATNAVLTLNSMTSNYGQVKIDTTTHQSVYQLVFDGEIQPKGSWEKVEAAQRTSTTTASPVLAFSTC